MHLPAKIAAELCRCCRHRIAGSHQLYAPIALKRRQHQREGAAEAMAALRQQGYLVSLLSGDDPTQAAFRRAGGDGCISVTANIAPALCAALHRACDARNTVEIARFQRILAPLHAALFLQTNPIPLKRALCHLGLMSDGLRLPLTPLGPLDDQKLIHALEAAEMAERIIALRFAASQPHQPRAA